MTKLLAYPLTVIYFILFGLTLVIFHPIQWLCLNVFGYKAHKISVDWLQFFIMRCLNVLGTRFSFSNPYQISSNQPVIIIANHQSMYDIPPLIWYMRKHHVKFISKKELGKGIPSVSFNLRHGGSALIDRKNPKQAIKAIEDFSHYIETTKRAAVIFPEGTRSRTGTPKPFQRKGLLTLFEHIPSATIVPVTINNSWKTLRYGKFPMGLGAHITFTVHEPIILSDSKDHIALINNIEQTITSSVKS
ncbi:1-acyl-sn-glycerol-3-phosphate acyltransferase [Meridianimaribacter sp. CL38]|uniref:lysophospholipid acyltransferase family protein n=1 Tax=Meridianimaribacter sp. CL38 TaxID=2213021 RepID=UPI00103C1D1F|nr:lysophospholipid acyltransferase family protein [Meridianimaribacter sp. CL38]TBV28193.1 1-acyl-sn-glycerol-3-phosphate acyltransferase [Meridianimaribacter sp. CL38]